MFERRAVSWRCTHTHNMHPHCCGLNVDSIWGTLSNRIKQNKNTGANAQNHIECQWRNDDDDDDTPESNVKCAERLCYYWHSPKWIPVNDLCASVCTINGNWTMCHACTRERIIESKILRATNVVMCTSFDAIIPLIFDMSGVLYGACLSTLQ